MNWFLQTVRRKVANKRSQTNVANELHTRMQHINNRQQSTMEATGGLLELRMNCSVCKLHVGDMRHPSLEATGRSAGKFITGRYQLVRARLDGTDVKLDVTCRRCGLRVGNMVAYGAQFGIKWRRAEVPRRAEVLAQSWSEAMAAQALVDLRVGNVIDLTESE